MGENRREIVEREISILDLMYYILKEWRKILLACVIGMFAFALFFVVKNRNIIFGDGEITISKDEQQDETKLTKESYDLLLKSYNDTIVNYRERINDLTEYKNNSVIMRLDPYNVPYMITDYVVDLDSTVDSNFNKDFNENMIKNISGDIKVEINGESYYNNKLNAVFDQYRRFFENDMNWSKIEELTGINKRYLMEVITFSNATNLHRFTITIKYDNEDILRKIQNIVDEEIENHVSVISDGMYSHSLTRTDYDVRYVNDGNVLNQQKSINDNINNALNTIDATNTKLTKFIKDNRDVANGDKLSFKQLLKYLIVGGFLGIFIIAFWYFLIYIFKGLMHMDDEIKSMYGIELFGVIKAVNENNKKENFIDGLIRKLLKHRTYDENEKDAIDRIGVFVDSIESDKVAFIGCGNKEKSEKIVDKIKNVVKNKDIDYIGNIVSYANNIKEMTKYDRYVLIEELECSKVSDISIEYDTVRSLKKKIEGYVVFDKN